MSSVGSRKVFMIAVILIYLSPSVRSQGNPYQCTSNGNYTRNSTYSANLNALLRSLSSNMSDYGFYSSSVATGPSHSAARASPDSSHAPTRGRLLFGGRRNFRAQAGCVGSRTTSDTTINALLQCTPDFSSEDCLRCLSEIASYLRNYISQGFRVLAPNCNLRYELYSFYNETRLRELGVPTPPPPPPPGPNDNNNNTRPRKKDDNTTKVIIIIVVPVAVTLIFAACAIIFMRKRMKRRRAYEITRTAEDISTVESLQYDFSSFRAATGDFDDAYKLGQGGFVAVHKGKLHTGEEVEIKRLSKDSGL